jgi:hypothetical protein
LTRSATGNKLVGLEGPVQCSQLAEGETMPPTTPSPSFRANG